jgi:hypothetical protein
MVSVMLWPPKGMAIMCTIFGCRISGEKIALGKIEV